MDWIKAHYDRVALIAAAVFLFISAAWIWHSAAHFGDNFTALQPTRPKGASPPAAAIALAEAEKKVAQPPQWSVSGRSALFVPDKHFVDAQGQLATLKTTAVHPPVPNEWLEEFGLPIAEADVIDQDPDGDGFSNLVEWKGHTNPTDKNSRPDYVAALRLKSVRDEPFRLLFSSWNPDTQTAQLETIDFSEPTQFLKVGDQIGGTRFKIVKFTEKHQTNPATGGDADVSELNLENVDTHDKLTLIKEKVATSPESVATFIYTWPAGSPPREFQVRKEQGFSLKPIEQIKYKLVDAQPTKAVIVNTQKPDQRIEISTGQ
ncbi:MAG: Amuc_1099 family pilus-like system protein [Verrucomicrobiota bacterium]